MKYICRGADGNNKYNIPFPYAVCTDCPHGKPHTKNDGKWWDCIPQSPWEYCSCIPVGLEYYMRKIIKEHEEIVQVGGNNG